MSVYIKGMEIPRNCYECPVRRRDGMDIVCPLVHERFSVADVNILFYRLKNCPLTPVQDHGRLIDADSIGITNFEIILCKQEKEPYKEALKMILDRIEKSPTIIPEDRRDSEE